jgi:cysteine desulfurase
MIYLDYSASTPVNKEVLDSFNKACLDFPGNSNSLHTLGNKANELIEMATKQIADILKVKSSEIIYTSGSSESNNLAIKGICNKYKNRGKHIITTHYEHSSVYGPLGYLQTLGYEVDFVNSKDDGTVDLEHLNSLLTDDTILVSINAINSEIGIIQPINEIGKIVSKFPKCFYHVDVTQAISKIDVDLSNVDLASFSAHKFFGLKGIGILIKKEKIALEPLIHGGKSTTVFRSGTPAHPLIVSISKALRMAVMDLDSKYNYVRELNQIVVKGLEKYPEVYINSNDKCLPHVLNVSVVGIKPETFLHALEKHEVYISTQTACSSEKAISGSVLALTNDEERAKSSIRISLSYITTKEEINKFLEIFDKCYKELKLK